VNVVSRIGGKSQKPCVLFNAHTDVVPVGGGWSVDPFSGTVINGAVYGRGSVDNKAGLTAMLFAAQALQEAGARLRGSITLSATVDEEIGGIAGLNYLVREGLVKGDYGISLDGSITDVGVSLNGRLRWRVHVLGRSVHSSVAFKGVNAIEKTAKVILAIQDHGRELQERRTRIPAPPEVGKPYIYPIASVNVVQGGIKDNIIPDRCTISLDRRITPEETVDSARDELRAAIERVRAEDPEVRFEIEEVSVREPCYTDPSHPLVKTVQRIASEVMARQIPVCGATGSSDVSFMVNQGGIPTATFGPSRIEGNVHGVDEHVSIVDLVSLAKVHALVAAELLC
jgi:succinyl-diaminopimelate desuccinylase